MPHKVFSVFQIMEVHDFFQRPRRFAISENRSECIHLFMEFLDLWGDLWGAEQVRWICNFYGKMIMSDKEYETSLCICEC